MVMAASFDGVKTKEESKAINQSINKSTQEPIDWQQQTIQVEGTYHGQARISEF